MKLGDPSILYRALGLDRADMPCKLAHWLLTLGFPGSDQQRMNELSAKASAGTLTDSEGSEIDTYILASDLLAILQSTARMAIAHEHA